jgi:GR25 family glycosyltransferase involved in LPS biosynthesis
MKACVFINLPDATDRRQGVEASFAAAQGGDWTLHHFQALSPTDVAATPGAITPTEKACFTSHRAALAQHLEGDDPVLIVEDDAVFSPQAFATLDALLAQNPDWDVIYPDAALCDFNLMIQLASRRDRMAERGEYLTVDLAGRSYFGATAYLVRGSAKRRLHAALSATELNQPYDLALRDLCHSGQFRMAVAFPFLTSVSALADGSQIQGADTQVFDTTLNAFRRLMYVARDLDQCRRDAERLQDLTIGDTASMAGDIFATIVSPAFPLDR